jgi:hypothetical protein
MHRTRWYRKILAWVALIGMGGTSFQLSGCSQDIRDNVLGGFNSATNTILVSLVDALFLALNNAGQDDDLTSGLTGGDSGA